MNWKTWSGRLLIIGTLWIIIASIWYSYKFFKPEPTIFVPKYEIKDGDKVVATLDEPISFIKSSKKTKNVPIKDIITPLKDYLRDNPDKELVIEGLYDKDKELGKDEQTSSLGRERAEALKNQLFGQGLDSSLVRTTSATDNNLIFDDNNDLVFNPMKVYLKERTLHLSDLFKQLKNGYPVKQFFEFNKSDVKINDDVALLLKFLGTYLKQNPNATIKIDGHACNIGTRKANKYISTARASNLKQLFIDRGIDPNIISTEAFGYDRPLASNETEEGKAKNRRSEVEIILDKPLELSDLISKLKNGYPVKHYFGFNQSKAKLNDDIMVLLEFLHKYLKQKPNTSIMVGGHACNIGTQKANKIVSTRRANNVKQLLIGKGIKPSIITAKGYSFDRPITNNDTEKGRTKNRCVEITIVENRNNKN